MLPGDKLVARQFVFAIIDGTLFGSVHPCPDQCDDGWIIVGAQERKHIAVDADPSVVEGEQHRTWRQWTPGVTRVAHILHRDDIITFGAQEIEMGHQVAEHDAIDLQRAPIARDIVVYQAQEVPAIAG